MKRFTQYILIAAAMTVLALAPAQCLAQSATAPAQSQTQQQPCAPQDSATQAAADLNTVSNAAANIGKQWGSVFGHKPKATTATTPTQNQAVAPANQTQNAAAPANKPANANQNAKPTAALTPQQLAAQRQQEQRQQQLQKQQQQQQAKQQQQHQQQPGQTASAQSGSAQAGSAQTGSSQSGSSTNPLMSMLNGGPSASGLTGGGSGAGGSGGNAASGSGGPKPCVPAGTTPQNNLVAGNNTAGGASATPAGPGAATLQSMTALPDGSYMLTYTPANSQDKSYVSLKRISSANKAGSPNDGYYTDDKNFYTVSGSQVTMTPIGGASGH